MENGRIVNSKKICQIMWRNFGVVARQLATLKSWTNKKLFVQRSFWCRSDGIKEGARLRGRRKNVIDTARPRINHFLARRIDAPFTMQMNIKLGMLDSK